MGAIRAGAIYFAVIFALAFALGVVRGLAVAPVVGGLAAVLIEIPVIFAACWVAARAVLRDRGFTAKQRAIMGAVAFVLLMLSEMLLARALRGQDVGQWLLEVATPLGLVGLTGQFGFAIMPLLVGRVR